MNYDYIKELNKENERRILNPFAVALVCVIAIAPVIILIIKFADWIDNQMTTMSEAVQITIGIVLVVVSLALLVRREIKRL
jgi:threonine/homoserine/homoserine lactone efflux protein